MARHFVVGAAVGVVAAVVGPVLGLITTIVAIIVVASLAAWQPRYAAMSGGLTALGAVWLILFGNSARLCADTPDFCGNANFAPWLSASLVILAAGLAFGLWTVRKRRALPPGTNK